jgi:hypothetical protein
MLNYPSLQVRHRNLPVATNVELQQFDLAAAKRVLLFVFLRPCGGGTVNRSVRRVTPPHNRAGTPEGLVCNA